MFLTTFFLSLSFSTYYIHTKNLDDVLEMQISKKEIYSQNKNTNNDKDQISKIIKHVFPFFNARDFTKYVTVSTFFHKSIQKYLEQNVKFGIINFTKQLEKYNPKIEYLDEREIQITKSNTNPIEKLNIEINFERENFYFPFYIKSSIPICSTDLDVDFFLNLIIGQYIEIEEIVFNPKKDQIFFYYPSLKIENFQIMSWLHFVLKGNSDFVLSYVIETQDSGTDLLHQIKSIDRCLCVCLLIFVSILLLLLVLTTYF
jgi:hypothetical protein